MGRGGVWRAPGAGPCAARPEQCWAARLCCHAGVSLMVASGKLSFISMSRRFCRRRRRGGRCCCCGRLPQSVCLFQSPSQSIIHCDRARRREGEREAAGGERRQQEEGGREQRGTAGACRGAGEAPGERGAKQRERW